MPSLQPLRRLSWLLITLAEVVWCSCWAQPFASSYSITWNKLSPDKRTVEVEASGLPSKTLERLRRTTPSTSEWQQVLSVFVEHPDPMDELGLPPVVGTYKVGRASIYFRPSYPLQPGVVYRAELRAPGLKPDGVGSRELPFCSTMKVPRAALVPTTMVREVRPTSDELPENLLKFYIQFSGPMSRGDIYEHIHLRTAAGAKVEDPFLEIDEELWDPSESRLTLFIDPGRIKRGVQPLDEVGPALEIGKRYILRIDRDLQDGSGQPLMASFDKSFVVGPPDRDPPDPVRWEVRAPVRGTQNALSVLFFESMDHALASRMIRVTDESGAPISGRSELADQERRWHFFPTTRWPSGRMKIQVQTAIEDLAGNNIGKAFDVDLFEGVQKRFVNTTISIPFEVR